MASATNSERTLGYARVKEGRKEPSAGKNPLCVLVTVFVVGCIGAQYHF
jgi:hypothetical protein